MNPFGSRDNVERVPPTYAEKQAQIPTGKTKKLGPHESDGPGTGAGASRRPPLEVYSEKLLGHSLGGYALGSVRA